MTSSLSLPIFLVLSFLIAGDSVLDPMAPMFAYSGPTGPEHWGELSPDYYQCSSGEVQSPVDINTDEVVFNDTSNPLNGKYSSSVKATLINSCYHIGVRFEENAGVLNIDGKDYTLKEMQWHSPSEHLIDGSQYAAELQLVHKADDESLAIVAILYESDDDDSDLSLSKIKEELKELSNVSCGEETSVFLRTLDLTELVDQDEVYFRYVGSLTTPPCSEKVVWTVLGEVRDISEDQVEAIKAPLDASYKKNARPTQPLNQRNIQLCDD